MARSITLYIFSMLFTYRIITYNIYYIFMYILYFCETALLKKIEKLRKFFSKFSVDLPLNHYWTHLLPQWGEIKQLPSTIIRSKSFNICIVQLLLIDLYLLSSPDHELEQRILPWPREAKEGTGYKFFFSIPCLKFLKDLLVNSCDTIPLA